VRVRRSVHGAPGRVTGGRPGVEDQRAGAVFVEELAREHGVGGVGGDGGEGAAELLVQFLEPAGVAGDPGDVRAVFGQGDGDSAAETRLAPVTSAVVPDSSCVGTRDSLMCARWWLG
jgi:hypothetical protein